MTYTPAPHQAYQPAQHFGPPPHGASHQHAPLPQDNTAFSPTPLAKRAIFTPYVVIWSVCGLLAAGYLATMSLVPELLGDVAPSSAYIADPQSNQGQRAAARLVSDVNGLKESISQVQLDLAKVKTDLATSNGREKAMNMQLTALEQKLETLKGGTQEAAAPQGDATPPNAANVPADIRAEIQDEPTAAPEAVAPAAKSRAAATPAQPKLVNADAATATATATNTGLETGSVNDAIKAVKPGKTAATVPAPLKAVVKPAPAAAAPAPATTQAAATPAPEEIVFGEPVVKPATGSVGVQISSGASVDSLRLSWSLLADRHGEALKNLEARYVAHGDVANPTYDLIAGPIKSKAEAQRVCKALAAKGVPCKIGDFLGEAL